MSSRTLLPLEPSPVLLEDYPRLPCSPRSEMFSPGYEITTHVFPSAYPRCPSSPWTPPPFPRDSPTDDKERARQTTQILASKKEAQEAGRDARPPDRNIIWTVANRVARISTPDPDVNKRPRLTLIFLHGIGAHKETWESTIKPLLHHLESSSCGINVEDLWMLDCVQHGDAGLLNEGLLGDTFDCADYSRDLMNFVLAFLPDSPPYLRQQRYPTKLPRLADAEVQRRKTHGLQFRTLLGVGHSIGACAYIHPSIHYPRLFSSLILIESFTNPPSIKHLDAHRKNEQICLRRRWIWDSREEAVSSIKQSAYYRSWHADVLEDYIRYVITETAEGQCRLKTHPFFEALMLFERSIVYEAWDLLAEVNPELPLHWVWGGKSRRGGGREMQAQTSYRHPGKNTTVWFEDVDHLLPQEAPHELADALFQFLLQSHSTPPKSRL